MQQLLEGTSASNIKSIEVITNPLAKYEAEGSTVLKIVASKNISLVIMAVFLKLINREVNILNFH